MRFTIRDVLWLTLVVALGVGWALDHLQLQTRNRRNEEKIVILTKMVEDSFARLDSYVPTWREWNRHF